MRLGSESSVQLRISIRSECERGLENPLTHDIDGIDGAGNAFWVIVNNVSCLENPLNGAGFDIELVVAKTVFPRRPFDQYITQPTACICPCLGPGLLPFLR